MECSLCDYQCSFIVNCGSYIIFPQDANLKGLGFGGDLNPTARTNFPAFYFYYVGGEMRWWFCREHCGWCPGSDAAGRPVGASIATHVTDRWRARGDRGARVLARTSLQSPAAPCTREMLPPLVSRYDWSGREPSDSHCQGSQVSPWPPGRCSRGLCQDQADRDQHRHARDGGRMVVGRLRGGAVPASSFLSDHQLSWQVTSATLSSSSSLSSSMFRVLSKISIKGSQLQLLASACLLVSWKIREHSAISAAKIVKYTNYNVKLEELLVSCNTVTWSNAMYLWPLASCV